MKAITIWQPWCSLIAIGAKPYEFRGWVAPKWVWNKRIGIHAGVRPVRKDEITDLIYRLQQGEANGTALDRDLALPLLEKVRQGLELPLGHMLGTAILGIPLPVSALPCVPQDSDRIDHSKYAWPLKRFEALVPPVPVKGAQGFWDWSE